MNVRPAGPGDEPVLENLLLEVYEAFGENAPRAELLRELVARSACGDSGLVFLLAEERGEIAGLLSLAPCPTTRDAGEFLFLDDFYVRPASRRQGIGTELLAAARRWAVARGACEIRLAADTTDEGSWRLHRAAGYERQSMNWMLLRLGTDWSGRRR